MGRFRFLTVMVTTKEQFKEAINKAINETSGECHGHWIAPDGHAIDVMFAHELSIVPVLLYMFHNKTISNPEFNRFARLNYKDMENVITVNDFFYKKGWLRGVKSGRDAYYANGTDGQRPTSRQRR